MIDTIVLTLTKDMYRISEPDKFKPSARWALQETTSSITGIQSKQNPLKRELLQGIYKPRLTLAARMGPLGGVATYLKIELSLPKLLFGNNFDELQLKDFPKLNAKLVVVLKDMGVITTPAQLAQTPVSKIHYSKNIILTDGSTPYYYISKIKEANVKMSLDVNETNYRNDGHSYMWHCNSYEVVFYDKIKELENAKKSPRKAIEQDNELQLNLFDSLRTKKKFEVLRMEVRLNKRPKIKQLLQSLGVNAVPSFRNLFKPAISQKVLLHYLDELEKRRSPLLDYRFTTDKALLTDLIFNNPELSAKRILQIYGLTKTLQHMTPRELRMMLNCSSSSWSKLMNEANKVKLNTVENTFNIIRQQLIKY